MGCRTCRTPTVTFLSSSWQINPGLEILVQQSTARTWCGGATLQRQSLGKVENKYRFLQGIKFVTRQGKVTSSRELGSLLCRAMEGGVEKLFVPVGFSDEAEQSQFPAANVPPLPSLWMKEVWSLCCTLSAQSPLQPRLCHLPQQDSPEPGSL